MLSQRAHTNRFGTVLKNEELVAFVGWGLSQTGAKREKVSVNLRLEHNPRGQYDGANYGLKIFVGF